MTDEESPYGGDRHLRLKGGNANQQGRVERALDLSGKSNVHLQFYAKSNDFESGDTAECRIYDGTGWHTVRTWTADDDYHFYDIDLSSYNMSSEFRIKFYADMNHVHDYFYVDNLVVTEVVP